MSGDNIISLGKIRNCDELANVLDGLSKQNISINQNLYLSNVLERVFKIGGFRVDTRKSSAIGDVVKEIRKLDSEKRERINQIIVEEFGEIDEETEKTLENSVVPTATLKELLKEYEEYLRIGMSETEALDRLASKNKGVVARAKIEDLIRKEAEVFEKIKGELREKAAATLDEAMVEKMAKEAAMEVVVSEEELVENLEIVRVVEKRVVAEKLEESLREAGVVRILENRISKEEFAEKIDEAISDIRNETVKELVKNLAYDSKDRIEIKIDVERKSWEVADKLIIALKQEDFFGELARRNEAVLRTVVSEKVSEEIFLGFSRNGEIEEMVAKELGKGGLVINEEQKSRIGQEIKSVRVELEKFSAGKKAEINKFQGDWLEKNIEDSVIRSNGKLSNEERSHLKEYSRLVRKIYHSDESLRIEGYKEDTVTFAEREGVGSGKADNAWSELKGLTMMLKMKSGELNAFLSQYQTVKAKLSRVNLPVNISECRALENITRAINTIPGGKNLLRYAKNYINLQAGLSNTGSLVASKLGLNKAGAMVLEKIGGQAMTDFLRHSLVVLSKNGTVGGIKLILKGIVSGGVKAGSAAGGGALAGAVAAFQAIPVAGQIALVVVGVIVAAKKILGPIVGRFKKILKSLNIDLGVSKFLKENFGGFLGGIMDVGIKIGIAIVGIPALLAGAAIGALIAPVLILFFVVFMLYQIIFVPNLISSVVPSRNDAVDSSTGGNSNYTPADPIYVADCADSPACAVISFLRASGVAAVNANNVQAVAELIRKWSSPPSSFDMETFIEKMIRSAKSYSYFQCYGFALAIDENLTSNAHVSQLLNNHAGCDVIKDSDAGAGDHVTDSRHIRVLSVLRPDRSFVISEANVGVPEAGVPGGQGGIRNVPGSSFDEYMANLRRQRPEVIILRCR
ncbi:MAG: hypothetical protein ACOX6N_02790 [Patescibacteria group bacterium]|jgi:hypothetical protein